MSFVFSLRIINEFKVSESHCLGLPYVGLYISHLAFPQKNGTGVYRY